jgi:hypothetical protein
MRASTLLLIVMIMQLASAACAAGSAMSSLFVTVTVVRPAPVTTIVNQKVGASKSDTQSTAPATTTTQAAGIQYVTIEY